MVVDLGDSGFDLRRGGATGGVLVLIKRDGMIQVEIQILHPFPVDWCCQGGGFG